MKSDLRARCRPGRHSREKPLIQHRPRTRAKFRAAVDAANAIPCLDWSLLNCCDFWLTGAFAPHSRSSFAVRSQSDPRSLSHLHQPKRICLLFSAVGVLCSTKEKKKKRKKFSLLSVDQKGPSSPFEPPILPSSIPSPILHSSTGPPFSPSLSVSLWSFPGGTTVPRLIASAGDRLLSFFSWFSSVPFPPYSVGDIDSFSPSVRPLIDSISCCAIDQAALLLSQSE